MLTSVALMAMTVLTGCGETELEKQARLDRQAQYAVIQQEKRQARLNAIQNCATDPGFTMRSCTEAYDYANGLNRPRLSSMSQCELEFGAHACRRNDSGFFTPMLTGYMLGSMMSSGPDYRTRTHVVYVSGNPTSKHYNKTAYNNRQAYKKSNPKMKTAVNVRTSKTTLPKRTVATTTKKKPATSNAAVASLKTGSKKSAKPANKPVPKKATSWAQKKTTAAKTKAVKKASTSSWNSGSRTTTSRNTATAQRSTLSRSSSRSSSSSRSRSSSRRR